MNKFDVFISYSSKDKTISDATCAAIESAGIRCWIAPRDITPGMEWGAAIINAIDNCRVFVLIFSTHANDSPQIHRETERAVNRGIPILPLRIEDIMPTGTMAYFVDDVHWLDAVTPPIENHLTRLAQSIRALLENSGDTTTAQRIPAQVGPKNIAEPSGMATPAYFAATANKPAASPSYGATAIQILCWVILVAFTSLDALFILGTVSDWEKPDRSSIITDLLAMIFFLIPAVVALAYIMRSRSKAAP